MLQRSSTVVATTESLLEHAWGRLYSQAALARGIGTELADLTLASVPHKALPSLQRPVYELIRQQDARFYADLARSGRIKLAPGAAIERFNERSVTLSPPAPSSPPTWSCWPPATAP